MTDAEQHRARLARLQKLAHRAFHLLRRARGQSHVDDAYAEQLLTNVNTREEPITATSGSRARSSANL